MTWIYDEPAEVYHADPAISSSAAKCYRHGGLRAVRDYLDASVQDSEALRLGRAFHSLALEPEKYDAEVAVKPDGLNLATKEGKAWKAANEHRCIVSHDDDARMRRMLDRLSPACRDALAGTHECVIRTTRGGLPVQCRFDVYAAGAGVDLKTVDCLDNFSRQVEALGYDFSAGWYSMCHELETGKPLEHWAWVVTEKAQPHRSALYIFPYLAQAHAEACEVADAIADAMAFDAWDDLPDLILEWAPAKWSDRYVV